MDNLLQDISQVNPIVLVLGLALVSMIWIITMRPDGRFAKWLKKKGIIE